MPAMVTGARFVGISSFGRAGRSEQLFNDGCDRLTLNLGPACPRVDNLVQQITTMRQDTS